MARHWRAARERERGEQCWIELCGGNVVTAEGAEAYLETKFGDHLDAARAAMTNLAHAYRPRVLAAEAFGLYETLRPAIPEGVKGWGAKGVLDLQNIRSLTKGQNHRRGPQAPGARKIQKAFPREKPGKTRSVRNRE